MAKKPKAEIIKRPIERMGDSAKKSAWSGAAESFITLLLGILFVIWPDTMIQAVSYIVGVIFIIKGALNIFFYFADKRNAYSNLLFTGLILGAIGIASLVAGPNIANVFRIIIGIFLIYESLSKFSSAAMLYYAKMEIWRIVIIMALIVLTLGIFVLFNETAAVIGWAMAIAGLIGLIGDIMFIQ